MGLRFAIIAAAGIALAGCKSRSSAPPPPPPPSDPPPPPSIAAPSPSALTADAGGQPRILVLGDSHLFGGLEASLKSALADGGKNQVWIYGACGSSPPTWNKGQITFCGGVEDVPGKPFKRGFAPSKTSPVEEILAEVKPQTTLLIMGSNFLKGAKELGDSIRELTGHLARAGSRCVWLGPPMIYSPTVTADERPLQRFYSELGQELGDRCEVLDSRRSGVKMIGAGDEVHVEPGSAAKWGAWAASRVLTGRDPAPAP